MANKAEINEEILEIQTKKEIIQENNKFLKNQIKEYCAEISKKEWPEWLKKEDMMLYKRMIKSFTRTNNKIIRAYNKMHNRLVGLLQ